jgi:putative heme-binding domain-containing protein
VGQASSRQPGLEQKVAEIAKKMMKCIELPLLTSWKKPIFSLRPWRASVPIAALLFLAMLAGRASAEDVSPEQRAKDARIVRTLLRLPGVDLADKPEAKASLLRYLAEQKGTEEYLQIAEKFSLRETKEELLRLAIEQGDSTLGVKAAGLLLKFGETDLLKKAIANPDPAKGAKVVASLGLLADAKTNDLLAPLIGDSQQPLTIRAAAVAAIGRNAPGQKWLLATVEQGKLAADLKFATANVLLSSADDAIKTAAGRHLALPAGAGGEPLPPVAELVKRTGDATRGKELFAGIGTCAKCHQVKGEGKQVGADLSEIGSKLSPEAMYVSILDPSAGISVGYENYLVRMIDGTVHTGILISQTDDAVELKTAEAIVHKLLRDDIDQLKKQSLSLMPADLQKQLKAQDLVDIVAYLTTLKKAN